ncbi:MAG TPA: putative toxin-antitoxin system toxin component, PIN family [Mucilaginibacter sp.]|jgi:putative PIN family toxin of toxin-antitoxin system
MAVKKIRLILDTNWYISATINKKSRRLLYQLLTDKNIVVLFSDEIITEYERVITRNKFKNIVNAQQISRFMNLVISKIKNIKIKSNLTGSRDTNDNFLLSLSHDANADYLVTGDKDLLILGKTGSTKIILMGDFLAIISNKTQ